MNDKQLQQAAQAQIDHFLHLARTQYVYAQAAYDRGREIPVPTVRFDLRGLTAGMASMKDGKTSVRVNMDIYRDNQAHYLNQTIPHEVAHLVAHAVFGPRIQAHGKEWKHVMEFFGCPADRCHTYAAKPARNIKTYTYKCACRSHKITSIRHNKMVRAERVYRCKSCAQPIALTGA